MFRFLRNSQAVLPSDLSFLTTANKERYQGEKEQNNITHNPNLTTAKVTLSGIDEMLQGKSQKLSD